MIDESGLPARVKRRSGDVFRAIAAAEGKIHGISPDEVHFHEVGAMDSIIDTIGVCLALENLGIDAVYASPVPTGQGKVRMAHGLYPIPAPATAELLTGIPLAALSAQGELTTPTGAGILKALATGFGDMPPLTIEKIGYGAGTKDFAHPNVLRAIALRGDSERAGGDGNVDKRETIHVVEAQLDDMTGEALGYAMERLFEAGAADVFFTPIFMKKNRPGTLVTVLAPGEALRRCEETLLAETTTLGIRYARWERRILDRSVTTVATAYGEVRVKSALRDGKRLRNAPEYEDVARLARQHGVAFHEVYRLAALAADNVPDRE